MARIAALRGLQPKDCCRLQNVRYDQWCHASPVGDVVMEQILEHRNASPFEEIPKGITFRPNIRRHKVLDIRRRLAEGTYDMTRRLDGVVERVLKAITA